MKKLTLLSMIFIFSISFSFSQQKDSVRYTTNSTTERLIDKYSTKIEASVAALAESLKQPAEHIYEVLVRQQVVKAWTWLIAIIFSFIITVGLWLLWFVDKEDRNEWWGVPLVVTIIFVILVASTLPIVFSGLINPEYGAMKEIVSFFK